MMRIAIVDYELGNLRSVSKAFERIGAPAELASRAEQIAAADALVLPGVGAFGDGMAGLNGRGLVAPLREAVSQGKPLLGICLGLQLFFERSDEAPGVEGLGFLRGTVRHFTGAAFGACGGLKVPHMGWNQLSFPRPHPLFAGTDPGVWVYFVHSYFVCPERDADAVACADYGGSFCAAAGSGCIVGCQFHPEKSQAAGLKMLENFVAWAQESPSAAAS